MIKARTVAISLLAMAMPTPDAGYDFLVLEMPHQAVMTDDLEFTVRGRPGNVFSVLGDVGNTTTTFANVRVHLDLTPMLTPIAIGVMPSRGWSTHQVTVPDEPALHGIVLHFQAFGQDTSALGNFASSDGKSVTFYKNEEQPLIRLLTVNDIPRDQNGEERNEGTLIVPPSGFTVDLLFDDRELSAIDTDSLVIVADQDLAAGAVPAGTNLREFFTITPTEATGVVDSRWDFPVDTTVVLTATILNRAGHPSPAEAFTVDCQAFTTTTQPFENKQIWWLDFERHDLDGTNVPDYREDLVLFGLGTDPSESTGASENVSQWTQEEILNQLHSVFGVGTPDPVNIDFVTQQPSGSFSTMCVGGRSQFPRSSLPPGAQETTGAAFLNARNRGDFLSNCYNGVASTGVYPRSIYRLFNQVPAFKQVFDPLSLRPVGSDPNDIEVTAPGFDPNTASPSLAQRHGEIRAGVDAFAQATAFILVQETCHSMGLVPKGKLGSGLLGSLLFGHSTSGHFDDGRGNFMSGNNSTPAPAQPANLALIWDHFVSGRAHFTPLNWAYLTERIIH